MALLGFRCLLGSQPQYKLYEGGAPDHLVHHVSPEQAWPVPCNRWPTRAGHRTLTGARGFARRVCSGCVLGRRPLDAFECSGARWGGGQLIIEQTEQRAQLCQKPL